MSKHAFIEMVDTLIVGHEKEYPEAYEYYCEFKKSNSKLSDTAIMVLTTLGAMAPSDEGYTSKEIAEEANVASRSVVGAMRKLIDSGYIAKSEDKPAKYRLLRKYEA